MRRLPTAAVLAACIASRAPAQHVLERISVAADGAQSNGRSYANTPHCMRADGREVAFISYATNLVPGDTNQARDVFVTDRITHAIRRMSLDSAGHEGSRDCEGEPCISADGRFVFFMSHSPNLVIGDTNASPDVFVRDRDPDGNGIFDEGNETTERVSVADDGSQGDSWSGVTACSPDGRLVLFGSFSDNLVAGDTNGAWDFFLRDRSAGSTTRVTVDSAGAEADGDSNEADLSADGRWVVFASDADNLVSNDGNGKADIFLRDLTNGVTTRVSTDPSGNDGNGDCYSPSITGDGSRIAFTSLSDNLVANDTNAFGDVFVHDPGTGATTLESVSLAGIPANNFSGGPRISQDGKFLLFTSFATDLVPQIATGFENAYLRDLAAGITTCASLNAAEHFGSGESYAGAISVDDKIIILGSSSENLVPLDDNDVWDVLALDTTIPDPVAAWTNYGSGWSGTLGIPGLVATTDPVVGEPFSISLGNSAGPWTVGLLVVGAGETSFVTRAGGTWLVDLVLVATTLPVAPGGISLGFDVPNDPAFCGVALYLQALELDPGATHGISFTPGLALSFGA